MPIVLIGQQGADLSAILAHELNVFEQILTLGYQVQTQQTQIENLSNQLRMAVEEIHILSQENKRLKAMAPEPDGKAAVRKTVQAGSIPVGASLFKRPKKCCDIQGPHDECCNRDYEHSHSYGPDGVTTWRADY